MCLIGESKAKPQARRNEHRQRSRSVMPSDERSVFDFSAGADPIHFRTRCNASLPTRNAGERQRELSCLSPTASGCGTERSEAAGQRSGSLAAAKWSGVQRTETDGVRRWVSCGGSLWMSARSHAPERSRSTVCQRFGACCVALTGLGNFFGRVTQGDALGCHIAPRWGFGWSGRRPPYLVACLSRD